MMAYKAYKFRIYPTNDQKVLIHKTFGCVRKVYNLLLSDKKAYYKMSGKMLNRNVTYYKNMPEYAYLKEVDSLALCNAKLNLDRAYKNFFEKRSGFPKFKVKGCHDSYTTNRTVDKAGHTNIAIIGDRIKLPKLGMVKFIQHRCIPVTETIKSCTISRVGNKYYIAILVAFEDVPVDPVPVCSDIKDRTIGLDYSVPDFYVDSNGYKPDFPRSYRKAQKRLAKLQKLKDRKKKGSNNQYKAKLRYQKLAAKVANQRKDFCHKESRRIANAYDVICLEDINLRHMSGSLKLGKSVMDCGFGMFRDFLEYKMAEKGGYVVYIDKWYPSSQFCSFCGNQNADVKDLSVRKWVCPVCGVGHDRDQNAAVNIKEEGLRLLFA